MRRHVALGPSCGPIGVHCRPMWADGPMTDGQVGPFGHKQWPGGQMGPSGFSSRLVSALGPWAHGAMSHHILSSYHPMVLVGEVGPSAPVGPGLSTLWFYSPVGLWAHAARGPLANWPRGTRAHATWALEPMCTLACARVGPYICGQQIERHFGDFRALGPMLSQSRVPWTHRPYINLYKLV